MEIAQLLAAAPVLAVHGPTGGEVTAITNSSAEVTPGACFVAIRGKWQDGHQYIADALARGASLIIGVDPAPAAFPSDRVYARVEDSRRELGTLAAALYGQPSDRMQV
ncbi:MAG: Mur ligase domain-containing protein, partial [Ktedonobacterales bacterium]